jgi:peptide/nickel transport system substrate-binding protein
MWRYGRWLIGLGVVLVGLVVRPVGAAPGLDHEPPSAEGESSPPMTLVTHNGVTEWMNCMAVEPASLYLYASQTRYDAGARTAAILQSNLYEALYVMRNGRYEARGLEKLPSFEDGDALIRPVQVSAGQQVVDAAGDVVRLAVGMTIVNAVGEVVTFDGRPVDMGQMVVEFTLRPMVWSDARPVVAADSVYSFAMAADPATPGRKDKVERTVSYLAVGERTVQWTGVPGWLDAAYVTNVWKPLPSHQLAGYTAAELLAVPETVSNPLSYGPYMVGEWGAGSYITLVRNPYYDWAAEVAVDRMLYVFGGEG